jgi:hypothetical protein
LAKSIPAGQALGVVFCVGSYAISYGDGSSAVEKFNVKENNMMLTKFYQITSGVILLMLTSFFSASALAQGPEFEKRKAERLRDLDQRIEKLQEHRTCVSGATSHEALRKCGDKMREWQRDGRDQRRELREERSENKSN